MLGRVVHRLSGGRWMAPRPVVGVLRLEGVIASRGGLRESLSLAGLSDRLDRVFGLRGLVAVALAINSPGGSPAQSALIESRIRLLAAKHAVPVLAFAEDVAASGGYWLALAADEIFATEGSIIGSIGVVSSGFGFTELLKRLGVERRLYAAGDNKAMLDPFSPEDPADVARLEALQRDLHDVFKDMVRKRRGARLKDDPEIFTGAIYTGRQAVSLGLIDGIGEMRAMMQDRFGPRVLLKLVGSKRRGLLRRLPIARTIVASVMTVIEERALWGRFGL